MPSARDLFERHHVAVFRFLRRMGSSAPDAEDLTQEVFLRVMQGLAGYQDQGMERVWVFRIVRNLLSDRWRGGARAPVAEPLSERLVGRSVAPLDRMAIDEALSRLADGEREAFLLREVGGLGYAEIAEATGASPDAVRSRIHRARLALREALGGGAAVRVAGGRER